MECTNFFKSPVPPLIHGKFDSDDTRETQYLDEEKNICVQKVSTAELNFRRDIFSGNRGSNFRISDEVLAKAAENFLYGSILGQSFEEYCEAVSKTSRISINTAKSAAKNLVESLKYISKRAQSSRRKNSFFFDDLNAVCPPKYGTIQVCRGKNLSVSLPGNSPGPNSVWLEALLYGYEVIIRPSFRDIFTPIRLAMSLINSGLPHSLISVVCCDYLAHDTLIENADLSLVFGGQKLELKYQNDPNVKVYGPGRSVTVLDPYIYNLKVRREIIDSVIGSGGVACFNTSLLLLTRPFDDFEKIFVCDLVSATKQRQFIGQDDRPIFSREGYQQLKNRLLTEAGIEIVYDGSSPVNETKIQAGPLVYKRTDTPNGKDIFEFPFPAVEISSLHKTNIENVVNRSLSTAVYSDDSDLLYQVFHSRSGGRVLINTNSATKFDRLPHDGHLSDFLLTERPFVKM